MDFEYEIGEVVEHICGQKMLILSRLTEECYAGTQQHYIVRGLLERTKAFTEQTIHVNRVELRKLSPATSSMDVMNIAKETLVALGDIEAAAQLRDLMDKLNKSRASAVRQQP